MVWKPRFKAVFMYLDHALISVFLSSFAPNALRARASGTLRDCVRYKNVVHLPENCCNLTFLLVNYELVRKNRAR